MQKINIPPDGFRGSLGQSGYPDFEWCFIPDDNHITRPEDPSFVKSISLAKEAIMAELRTGEPVGRLQVDRILEVQPPLALDDIDIALTHLSADGTTKLTPFGYMLRKQ